MKDETEFSAVKSRPKRNGRNWNKVVGRNINGKKILYFSFIKEKKLDSYYFFFNFLTKLIFNEIDI